MPAPKFKKIYDQDANGEIVQRNEASESTSDNFRKMAAPARPVAQQSITPTSASLPVTVAYNPYEQYAQAYRSAADLTYQNAVQNANTLRSQSILDAQNAYRNARPTYGANAERYLASGLTGSGLSDYAGASAYAAMRGEIANANAVNAYAQQSALYNREQAYAQAYAYKAQAEQNVYQNLLESVLNGKISAEMVEPVASAYGLSNPNALSALKNAAGTVAAQQRAQLEAQKKQYEDAYQYILDNGINDAETAAEVAEQAGLADDSDAYASIISAAEQNAERQKTISNAGNVVWSATNVNGARNDAFTLKIGDAEFRLSTKSSNEVKDQSTIDSLNEMATGDKEKKPIATNGKNNSSDNAGAIQVLNGKMYMYKQNRGVWVEVTDRNKNNKVETAIKAWNDASLKGRLAYYNTMTDAEKQEFIASAFGNENTLEGIESLANGLKNAGFSEDVINKATEARITAYRESADSAIPTQYKDVPSKSAYKEHLEDLNDDMLTDEQKQKVKDAFVQNQGINGLLQIFDDKVKKMFEYDYTGKKFDGYINNSKQVLAEKGGLKEIFAELGYKITDQQEKDIERVRAEVLNPMPAEEYADYRNRY